MQEHEPQAPGQLIASLVGTDLFPCGQLHASIFLAERQRYQERFCR